MAYSHVAGTPQSALSAALAIPYPAGVAAGQLLVVIAAVRDYNGATGVTAPSGFTLRSTSSPGTNDTIWLYERIADGTESGTVTFDTGTSAGQKAVMLSFPPRAGRRWPAAGAFVAATEGDTAGGSTMTYNARTIGATDRLGLQIAKEPTTGTVTGVGTTAGFTQAFWSWDSTTNMVLAAQYIELTGNMSANAVTLTGNSGTSASPSLTAEFQDEAASITITVDDDTPSPTQAIVITKSGGDFAGTVVAELHDADDNFVDVSAFLTGTGATRTLTLGGGSRDNYDDANATWELIPWGEVLTLRVTDSGGSGTDTLTIIPPVEDHFGVRGTTVDYEVAGSANTDQIYVDVITGDGEGLPEISSFQGNSVPSTVRFRAFRRASNPKKWLTYREEIFDVVSSSLTGGYADTFTGTDGTLITAHTPNSDVVGRGYTIEKDRASSPAVSNAVTLQGGKLYVNDANEGAVIDVGTIEPDFSWNWDAVTGKEFVAQVLRLDDTEHVHLYVKQSGLIRVNERVADANIGVTGTNETTYAFTNGVTYRIRVVVIGLRITVYVDDVQQLQVTRIRSANSHATKVGLFSAGTGTFPVQFDDANAETDYTAESLGFSKASHAPDAPVSRNELKWASGFGNAAWTKIGSVTTTFSSGAGPEGRDAWILTPTAGSALKYVYERVTLSVTAGGAWSAQIKIKPGTENSCAVVLESSASATLRLSYNFDTGVATAAATSATVTSSSVTADADGFYLFVLSGTFTSAATWLQWAVFVDAYAVTSSTGTLYLAEAQLETGSTAHDYVHTETVPLRSDQVIVRARQPHNLVGYSNDLSNAAWTKTRCSISGSITLNAGASNGWGSSVLYKVVEDTSTDTHLVNNTADAMSGNSSGVVACRFLAQGDGTRNHLTVRVYGDSASNYYTYTINLTDGTNSSSSVTGTAALYSLTTTLVDTVSSRPVYEVIVRGWPSTTSDTSIYQLMFLLHNGTTNTYLGTSNGVYLGKIHVVNEYELPDYDETTTAEPIFASNVSGVTLNSVVASIAQDALILHTEDQSQTTPWSRTNIHAVTAEGVSADGYPAYKVDCNTTAGTHSLGIATTQKTLTDNTNITVFVDAKADERTWIAIGGRTKANVYPSAYFDLSAGTEHTNNSMVEASIESRGTGWYRLRGVFSVASGGTTPGMALWVVEADNDNFFAGLGANDGLLVSRCFAVEGNVAMADADAAYVRAGSTMEYVRDRSSAIVTLPSIDKFDAAGTHVNSGFNRNLDFTLGDGTTTVSDTFQIIPTTNIASGVLGAGSWGLPGVESRIGNETFMQTISGEAALNPNQLNAVALTESATVRIREFIPAEERWVAVRDVAASTTNYISDPADHTPTMATSTLSLTAFLDSVAAAVLYSMKTSSIAGDEVFISVPAELEYFLNSSVLEGHKTNYERWATRPPVSSTWTTRDDL